MLTGCTKTRFGEIVGESIVTIVTLAYYTIIRLHVLPEVSGCPNLGS